MLESVLLEDVITKLVPTVLAVTLTNPGVPLSDCDVTKIKLFAVTVVLDTVTVPDERDAVPILQLLPDLIERPNPAVAI